MLSFPIVLVVDLFSATNDGRKKMLGCTKLTPIRSDCQLPFCGEIA